MTLATSPCRNSGYTLLEILVVIVLISGLAGLGLGMITGSGNDLERASVGVRDFARIARANAQFYRAPARVVMTPPPGTAIDPASGELRQMKVLALQSVAEWNFEDGSPNASRGIDAQLGGGYVEEGGRVGQGFFADGEGSQHGITLDARGLSSFDLRGGFVVRCDIKLNTRQVCTVVRFGEAFELGVDSVGKLRAGVTLARGAGQAGRRVVLKGSRRLPLGEWVKIELIADGTRIVLRRDFIEEASERVKDRCWRDAEAQFVISDGGAPVPGVLDTIEVFAFDTIAEQPIPETVEVSEGPAILHFDPYGLIDRRFHAELPRYRLSQPDGEQVIGFELGGLAK